MWWSDYFSQDKTEAVAQRRCSVKSWFRASVSFLIKLQAISLQLYYKETLARVFSCEFCKISKNTFSYRTPPVTASDEKLNILKTKRALKMTFIFYHF